MKKRYLIVFTVMILVCSILVLAACDGTETSEKLKVKFIVDGEVFHSVETAGNETIALPTATPKDGYDFAGWFRDKDVWSQEFTANSLENETLTADLSVYARFIEKEKYYTVTFETNGGLASYLDQNGNSYLGEVDTELVKAGTRCDNADNVLKKNNMVFAGWHDNEQLSGEVIKIPFFPSADITLYADWAEERVTVEGGFVLEYRYYVTHDIGLYDGYVITRYEGTDSDITLPSAHKGIPVVDIQGSVFLGNTTLTSLVVPSSYKTIGGQAFYACTNLTRLVLDDGLETIEYDAFAGCEALSDITFGNELKVFEENVFYRTAWYDSQPNGAVYAGSVFYNYKGLIEGAFEVKEGTKGIAANAFNNQIEMTGITLPESLEVIGHYAFFQCSGLTEINLGNRVQRLGGYAFARCSNLTSFVMPDSVLDLGIGRGGSIFSGCKKLTSVTLSNNLLNSDLSYGMFEDTGITSLVLPASWDKNFAIANGLLGANSLTTLTILIPSVISISTLPPSVTAIYVPAELLEQYKAAEFEGWSKHADKIFAIS